MHNITSNFDCRGLHLQGIEILCATSMYLTLVGIFCVTFIDVAVKQCWPQKFLDPIVYKRVLALRVHFPKIKDKLGAVVYHELEMEMEAKQKEEAQAKANAKNEKEWNELEMEMEVKQKPTKNEEEWNDKGEEAAVNKTATRSSSSRGRSTSKKQATQKKVAKVVAEKDEEEDEEDKKAAACTKALEDLKYDTIVSQESYAATCCVDEDLVYCLANGDAFSTVSEYCASTVRGYTMLSTFLAMTSTVLGFLWIHNSRISPIGDNYWRYTGIAGYFFCFLTAMLMVPPNRNTVYRNRNIVLWGSVMTDNAILTLHEIGMLIFLLLPLVGNYAQLRTLDDAQLPNKEAMWIGFASQMIGTVLFVLSHVINITGCLCNSKPLRRKRVAIFAELLMIISGMVSFLQIETYSTAACLDANRKYGVSIIATLATLFSFFCLKRKWFNSAPVSAAFANGPSVLLLFKGEPVATSGPTPALNYNRKVAGLPNVEPQPLKMWSSQ